MFFLSCKVFLVVDIDDLILSNVDGDVDQRNEEFMNKNLSIADILYSGHLLITDTFSGNGLIKNLIENLFLAETSL